MPSFKCTIRANAQRIPSEPQSIQRQSGLSAFWKLCCHKCIPFERTCEQSRTLFLCAAVAPSIPSDRMYFLCFECVACALKLPIMRTRSKACGWWTLSIQSLNSHHSPWDGDPSACCCVYTTVVMLFWIVKKSTFKLESLIYTNTQTKCRKQGQKCSNWTKNKRYIRMYLCVSEDCTKKFEGERTQMDFGQNESLLRKLNSKEFPN